MLIINEIGENGKNCLKIQDATIIKKKKKFICCELPRG